jgi:hypothetical protein
MELSVTLNEKSYKVTYTEAFSNKLQDINSNFNHVLKELEQGQEKLANVSLNEEFFVVGSNYGFHGVMKDGVIELVKLITTIL